MIRIIFAIINSISAVIVIGFCFFGLLMSGGYTENIHTVKQIVGKIILLPAVLIATVCGAIAGWMLVAKKEKASSKALRILSPLPVLILIWLIKINFF